MNWVEPGKGGTTILILLRKPNNRFELYKAILKQPKHDKRVMLIKEGH